MSIPLYTFDIGKNQRISERLGTIEAYETMNLRDALPLRDGQIIINTIGSSHLNLDILHWLVLSDIRRKAKTLGADAVYSVKVIHRLENDILTVNAVGLAVKLMSTIPD